MKTFEHLYFVQICMEKRTCIMYVTCNMWRIYYMSYAMRYFQKPEYQELVLVQILKRFCSQLLYRYRYRFTICGPQLSSLRLSKLHSLSWKRRIELKKKSPSARVTSRWEARKAREIPLIHVSDSRYDIMLYSLR